MKSKRIFSILLCLSLLVVTLFTGCASKTKATLPKDPCLVDLHLHVDGAMTVDTALKLAQMQSIELPTTDRTELEELLYVSEGCRDLNEFLEKFAIPCSLLQTKEALSEAIYMIQEESKEAGAIYAELRFAPQKHMDLGMTQEDAVLAAIDGLNRSDLKANLILCCMRGDGLEEENMETVRLADKYRNQGVVAVDLAGAEALFPTADYEKVFAYANELNVNITLHAGEADGPESIKKALSFGAKRIGHGVRAYEDESLMDELAKNKIPLELCVTSNLQTKAIDDIKTYPLRKFLDRGMVVTLNTDDPAISRINLRKEIEMDINEFNLTEDELISILKNSINYSFADDATKKELLDTLNKAFGK